MLNATPCFRFLSSMGGTIGLMHESDSVTIDAIQLLIQLNVDEAEIATRKAVWKTPAPRYTRGVLGKYFKLVGPASKGAVTDLPSWQNPIASIY